MSSPSLAKLTPEQLELLAARLSSRRAAAQAHEPRRASFTVTSAEHELFSRMSHDRNPIHVSEEHVRQTPFGEIVVFGCLSGLACLGLVGERPGRRLASFTLQMVSPLARDQQYSAQILDAAPDRARIEVHDGKRLLLRLTTDHAEGPAAAAAAVVPAEGSPCPSLAEPVDRPRASLRPGLTLEGVYSPRWEHVAALMEQIPVTRVGMTATEVAALALASYLVGMEAPGLRSMFSELSMRFDAGLRHEWVDRISYHARVVAFDEQLSLLTLSVSMFVGGAPLAEATIRAFACVAAPTADVAALDGGLPRSTRLRGRVALVIGASRGLGAAIASALALQGCTVFGTFLRSRAEAERVRERMAGASGEIIPVQADAGDLAQCLEVKRRLVAEHGRLDYLISNACPALLPLALEPEALARIIAYMTESIALASTPMATFLGLLSATSGAHVVISSMQVLSATPELAHYSGAKCAIESLARAAAAEHRAVSTLIVRPSKLLTALINTPTGRIGAAPVEGVTIEIMKRLLSAACPGRVEVLENISFIPADRAKEEALDERTS